MESTRKRDFPRLFKGLRNLQCQENGAPTRRQVYLYYSIKSIAYAF